MIPIKDKYSLVQYLNSGTDSNSYENSSYAKCASWLIGYRRWLSAQGSWVQSRSGGMIQVSGSSDLIKKNYLIWGIS